MDSDGASSASECSHRFVIREEKQKKSKEKEKRPKRRASAESPTKSEHKKKKRKSELSAQMTAINKKQKKSKGKEKREKEASTEVIPTSTISEHKKKKKDKVKSELSEVLAEAEDKLNEIKDKLKANPTMSFSNCMIHLYKNVVEKAESYEKNLKNRVQDLTLEAEETQAELDQMMNETILEINSHCNYIKKKFE